MEEQDAPNYRRMLANELRKLREEAHMTVREAAERLEFSKSKLSKIENAEQRVDIHTARSMLDLYDIGGANNSRIQDLVRRALEKPWWQAFGIGSRGFAAVEHDACEEFEFQLALVPGLLQTEEYARAVFASTEPRLSTDQIEQQVEIRMRRQRRLKGPAALTLWVIIDERALRQPVGGPEVMRDQLAHLIKMSELPNVTVQVLPSSVGAHPAQVSSFVVLTYPSPDDLDVAVFDYVTGSVHTQKKPEVRTCRVVFDRLRGEALDPTASIEFIQQVTREL